MVLGIGKLWRRLAGRHYRKFVKRCEPIVGKINDFDRQFCSLDDGQLRAKSEEFRRRIGGGESLDDILPEAFAAVKNAARRLCGSRFTVCGEEIEWKMVPYDVQLIGGIALHSNKIAEMATGEGKTLVATLPLYLNALTGRNCQLVTVNDYLARRDSEWMGKLFSFLGLSVGCIQSGMEPDERKEAYACDITYGTASELGFDYLRDMGLAISAEDQVQRGHYFCIVDEIDSVLIDEARTPLIISGPVMENRSLPYGELCSTVERLTQLQLQLCNRLVAEAKELLEKNPGDGDGFLKLYAVRLGMPKHRQLCKLMESGALAKRLEKLEGEMASDLHRDERFELKETLYFTVDERQNSADLTELGRKTLFPEDPDAFVVPDLASICAEIDRSDEVTLQEKQQKKMEAAERAAAIGERIHCIGQLIRANTLFERDQHYIVHGGQVLIVDQNTGRAMVGRRWSDGLHQAIEAKEGLEIQRENRTLATITVQNYFRLYEKLAGMTGTAETEAQEFQDIYRLSVVAIPTNVPCVRRDGDDVVYKTRREKYAAVIADIESSQAKGQPVLVGTTSVEASELLARMLQAKKLPHAVLNAKFHEAEAKIIAKAGEVGAITIATNMAGRGTDITLGDGVRALGGLRVIGTERHEARRIDRQLRGRCARQGDPGESQFYVALEDDLMRLFAGRGPMGALLDRTFREGDVLAHPLINRSIASAQRKVEQQNYAMRRRLLQYDDVLSAQRDIIYSLRDSVLHVERPWLIVAELVQNLLSRLCAFDGNDSASAEAAAVQLGAMFPIAISVNELLQNSEESRIQLAMERMGKAYAIKESLEKPEDIVRLERIILLRSIDRHWQEHLSSMDDLRNSVGLRSYAQKNPLYEYKTEAFEHFRQMMADIERDVAFSLFRSASSAEKLREMIGTMQLRSGNGIPPEPKKTIAIPQSLTRKLPSVGRNEVCPCGSGRKYKKCCGVSK
ncbi:MAG: preprotein translocase subunit SecA [Puniceicoccales bacterium]|jgi:preprotein translocase subunit SecA|nr:preprotein translocase subunit SecA [Puniceicoccales bacterium]